MTDKYGKTKVLVLDDERLIRMTLGAKLRRIGYISVEVGTVDDAVEQLRDGGHRKFRAIITDIMMGNMDGFVFRDIVRGLDKTMPIFFMTALDPEEGGGFLKRIMEDANSYYLPKSVKAEVLLKRVQSIVASRRVEQFIERQVAESKQALVLAAHVQHSMLPVRAILTPRGFYTTLWQPKDTVSGDLYEAIPFGFGCYLYVLGDIQGHGTSAALAMTAAQSFLKQLAQRDGSHSLGPEAIANMMQKFFRTHLAGVSYMTALICIHKPLQHEVRWISCGAPDLVVLDPEDPSAQAVNPDHRGSLPIGLMEDTVYSESEVVKTHLSQSAVCVAYTDGMFDISRDPEGLEQMPDDLRRRLRNELVLDARSNGSIVAAPYKFMEACKAYGYCHCDDDITSLVFGAHLFLDGVYEATVPMSPESVDRVAQEMGQWCEDQKWSLDISTRVQLVFEEKMMNLHDHGFDDRERLREVANVRLRRKGDAAELTIWDCGTQEPSIEVATGDSDVAFELKNRSFSGRGRGRLMVRELCVGIERSRYGMLNETSYYIPFERPEE